MANKLCEILNIKYPIIQGGMAWVADANLAAAVSNAGGLGLIAAMNSNKEQLREQIRKCRTLTNKVFGVNIMLMSPFADEVSDVVIEEKIEVVTTGAGSPKKYMKKWIDAGIKVIPVIPAVSIAKLMEKLGATAVVAEGGESGGHVGDLTTMCLVPQVVDAVNIPVIAAGGIADGRGFAASIMLGASGIQVGTRFLTAKECNIHQNYKDMVINARDTDTIVTGRKLGHPVRAFKTIFTRNFQQMENDPNLSIEDLEKAGGGALRVATQEGDVEKGSFMAGQIAGMVKKEETCEEIINDFMNGLKKVVERRKNLEEII